jgi:hypothetical protein
MKKFLKFGKMLIVSLFLLVVTPICIMAQGDAPPPAVGFDFMSLFTSFAGFGAGVILLTGLIATHIGNWSAHGKSILSWVIAALVGLAGWYFKLGIFNAIPWYQVIAIVVSFALGSNVIYNVDWIRNLLSGLKLAPPKKE